MNNSSPDIKQLIIEGIQERKGTDITIVDMSNINSAATETFVICQGTSTTHTASIAESVEEYVRTKCGLKPYGIDGEEGSDWVVMDYGNVWVHVFMPETRRRYNLEELWSDAIIEQIPNLD